jgi:hypothetical protein
MSNEKMIRLYQKHPDVPFNNSKIKDFFAQF